MKDLIAALCVTAVVACGPSVRGDADSDDGDDSAGSADTGPGDASDGADAGTAPGSASADDGPMTSADGTGDPTDGGPPPADGTQVAAGENFVDAFFTPNGLIVVHAGGAQLVARDGTLVLDYASPRTITAADWADELLVLADAASFVTLDAEFAVVGTGLLTESCLGVAITSGARVACGPENDWDRVFYTYDAIGGELLATSMPYTYNGIPMRRVPGFDEFVSVTHDLSPSDFHLYAVDAASDTVVYVNESPYHGDFAVRLGYAFAGDPATHVITEQGHLLLIHGDGCVIGSVFESGCFIKDGELGTLPADASTYDSLREAADGTVYGLVGSGDYYYTDPPCQSSCTLQHIDVTNRVVLGESTISTSREFNFLRPDPAGGGVAVIAAATAPFYYAFDANSTGFEVLYYSL